MKFCWLIVFVIFSSLVGAEEAPVSNSDAVPLMLPNVVPAGPVDMIPIPTDGIRENTPGIVGSLVTQDYVLGGGDILKITIFQSIDLTTETRVSETGVIVFPLLGEVKVGGLSVADAAKKIASDLKSREFLVNPQVNVLVTQIKGNQVSVLGQVNRPGRYPLETFKTRVSDMLATAGGVIVGGGDKVVLVGIRDGKQFRQEVDLADIYVTAQREDNLTVAGGDVIYVPKPPVYYIYGEVQRPGSYRIERGMTARQALALAGGLTARGTERRMKVERQLENGEKDMVSIELTDVVRADDVIYVRESLF